MDGKRTNFLLRWSLVITTCFPFMETGNPRYFENTTSKEKMHSWVHWREAMYLASQLIHTFARLFMSQLHLFNFFMFSYQHLHQMSLIIVLLCLVRSYFNLGVCALLRLHQVKGTLKGRGKKMGKWAESERQFPIDKVVQRASTLPSRVKSISFLLDISIPSSVHLLLIRW